MSVPLKMDSEDSFYHNEVHEEEQGMTHQEAFHYEDTIRDQQHGMHYKVGYNNKNDYKVTADNNGFLVDNATRATSFDTDILWITGVAMFIFVILVCCSVSIFVMLRTRKKQRGAVPILLTSAAVGRRR